MAFFRVYPRQPEYYQPPKEALADAILAGLSQGMTDLDQFLGPYHRARTCRAPGACGGASQRPSSNHKPQQRRTPTVRDPPHAWMWWMLGGGDSSDSEEDTQAATAATKPSRGRPCAEESCAMKRKPSRSASNAPPSKKKDEQKTDEETTPKFNFTGRKTSDKSKTQKKETKKSEKKSEPEVVLVKPAPWRHVVNVSSDFGPEDVKVYVRDGRIRVEGRRELNVGKDDDVIECLEVNRELVVPNDVVLDDLSVFFRSGGRLELEAPRKVHEQKHQTELVKNLESMSVDDIEKDAEAAESQDTVEETKDDLENSEDVKNSADEAVEEESEEKDEQAEDWEMLPEDKTDNPDNVVANDTETEIANDNDEEIKDKLEEAAEEEEKEEIQGENQENVKISEIEEITTKPIVEEPAETNNSIATEEQPNNLVVRVVSEDQQQAQIEENNQLLVMNLTGFEPRDVTVTSDAGRVAVRAVRETEQEGFISRKENFRAFRLPDHVKTAQLTCTMGPEANLVITSPSA